MLRARPKTQSMINNQKGLATLEAIPMIVIFVMLIGYMLGLYGAIHTATLNSIGARAYAFETFRHRTDLSYLRDYPLSTSGVQHYDEAGYRYHGIAIDDESNRFLAPHRNISMGRLPTSSDVIDVNKENQKIHTEKIYSLELRNREVQVDPIWIMVAYGMCLNPSCGGK